jgi:aminomethyltransferase
MEGRGTARHGYSIYANETDGAAIGVVTSGSLGPTVGKNIGLGYVPVAQANVGGRVFVDCRGKRIAAVIVKGPFYKRSAA